MNYQRLSVSTEPMEPLSLKLSQRWERDTTPSYVFLPFVKEIAQAGVPV